MEIPKGFKQTEFGFIPEDWVESNWGDCLKTFSSGATPYRGVPAYYKGNVKWISSGELNYNVINDTIEHISEQAVRDTNLKVHQPGTMLMAITGLEAEGTRGRCALIGSPATTNQSCLAINGSDKVCIEYLFEFYKMFGCSLAFKYCQGTKQQSFTADIVKKLPIVYPKSIDEQKRIAAVLSDVDEQIDALNQLIKKKRQIKEGAMQQLLIGKTRLPGFNGIWKMLTLVDVASVRSGFPFKSETYTNIGKYSVITIANVQNGYLNLSECNKVSEYPKGLQEFQKLKLGDILVSMTGNVGRVCLVSMQNCLLNQRVGLIEPKDNISKDFLFTLLNSYYFETSMIEKGQGAAQANLSNKDIEAYAFSAPESKDEQNAIATILSNMEEEIRQLEKERDKYTLVKQGMMQELLTGKTRLN